jgi:hypothetical protein
MMKSKLLALALLLAACGENVPPEYLKIAGGGIQFNYRVSEASMIVIAQQKQPLPEGSKVEALFDIPGTNTREAVSEPAMPGKLSYSLQSSKMMKITKGGKYKVTIRLLDAKGQELDRKETVYESDQDQSTLPTKPLVDGPALTPQLQNL